MNSAVVAVKMEQVNKKIKQSTVLEDITLTIREGSITGLIGRNGSGKTMVMRLICGLIKPTSGTIHVFHEKISESSKLPDQVGALIETPGFLPQYSGFKNLKLLASIRNTTTDQEILEMLNIVGLDPTNKKPVRTYSLGMRQRLGIAQALMEKPKLVVLDEPTNGLDEQGVSELRNLLIKKKQEGVTIILASHNREDIELLCDQVYEMEHGRLRNGNRQGGTERTY